MGNVLKPHIAIIFIMVVVLAGCAANSYSISFGKIPQTPEEYRNMVLVPQHLKPQERVISIGFNEALKNLRRLSTQCYTYEVNTYIRSKEHHANAWTSKVTMIAPNLALFTMQVKGLRKTKDVVMKEGEKVPPDGQWMYGIELIDMGDRNSKAVMYAPWGWGSTVNGVVDAVEGKYGDKCPPKNVIHPAVEK